MFTILLSFAFSTESMAGIGKKDQPIKHFQHIMQFQHMSPSTFSDIFGILKSYKISELFENLNILKILNFFNFLKVFF